MRTTDVSLNALETNLGHGSSRKAARNLALGTLAAALIATTALPAFAGKPDHGRHGNRHVQQQEHDIHGAGKRRGKKAVRKVFSKGEPIAILDDRAADPFPSTISVKGFKKAKIADVNLTLAGLSHTLPSDLQVLLVAPGGRNAVVMAEVGRDDEDTRVTDITLTLDDEAVEALPLKNALTSGPFRPLANEDLSTLNFPAPAPAPSGSVALATFDGGNPNGEWQLFIVDSAQDDAGRLDGGWQLEITAKKAKNANKKKR